MRLLAIVTLACLAGCSHPLEIAGEGDIFSASGERDCSLEEYNSGAPTCSENYITVHMTRSTKPCRVRDGSSQAGKTVSTQIRKHSIAVFQYLQRLCKIFGVIPRHLWSHTSLNFPQLFRRLQICMMRRRIWRPLSRYPPHPP